MSYDDRKSLHTFHQDVISVVISVLINGLLFSGFVAISHQEEEVEKPKAEDVQWVALTALGEVMPKALPRIVAPDEAPVQTSTAVSISRAKKEQAQKKEKKSKKIEKNPRPKAKAKPKKRRKTRKPKKGSLESLFSRDERADRGKRRGDHRGHAGGTSTTWQESTEMSLYLNRVKTLVQRRFKPPSTLSKRQLQKLSTKIYIRINRKGRIKGEPKWKQKSGNKFYDNASIRALDPFLVDKGVARLPLPKSKDLRKEVLRRGFDFVLAGKDIR